MSEVLSNLRKRENYKAAIAKAERESATTFADEEQEEDQDLLSSLSAIRKKTFVQKNEELLKVLSLFVFFSPHLFVFSLSYPSENPRSTHQGGTD